MQGFEIDHKAFRAQNVGRPPEHLIREAIQNAFDESPQVINVTIVEAEGRGLHVEVSDNGPGFKDERDIWTIFASGKRDDCKKRGRLGRGLKELISVATDATVETAGKRIVFKWNGRTLSRSARKCSTAGTKVSVYVPSWKKSDMDRIVSYLRLFIPPEGTTMYVNGVANERPNCEREFRACLPTVAYDEDGVPKDTWATAPVRLLDGKRERWIYEMGIPIEKVLEEDGFKWSIDVGQRTPLRPERDLLPRRYVHALYAYVANEMVDTVPAEDLTALWMEEGVGNHNFDKTRHGKTYVERRFGQHAARAVVNDPHDTNVHAQQQGINVIRVEQVSASVRDLLRDTLPTTTQLFPQSHAPTRFIPQECWTEGEQRFVAFAKWLAAGLCLPEPKMMILDAPQACCEADSSNSGTLIRVNRGTLGASFFDRPSLSKWLPLIVHELAHRTGNGHDHVFWREVERLFGEAAEWVFHHQDDKLRLMGV